MPSIQAKLISGLFKLIGFDIETKDIEGTVCYVTKVKGAVPKRAVLYLFGGGYILPPDPGDIIL